ncbi:MAG: SpoIIE family protein phosphatase [Bellilinea sp.]
MSESNQPLRVTTACDQPIFLRGMVNILQTIKGVQLVGEAQSGDDAFQLCKLTQPDLLLLDLKDVLDARRIASAIHQECIQVRIILLHDCQDEDPALEDLAAERLFVISRDVSEEEFKAAFDRVRREPLPPVPRADAIPSNPALPIPTRAVDSAPKATTPAAVAAPTRTGDLMARELYMAGKIQADILPEKAPALQGWAISAELEPARETSGDFYDFIPLTQQKWGLVIADVSDKGMGAALFMALSSSLMRTYAARFPTLPSLTMSAVNERILTDTRGSMFVTAFFGILEQNTGRLIYTNAGHPPGYIIGNPRGKNPILALRTTGMALGASETGRWTQKIVKLAPGDLLVLYTDGITEAANPDGVMFGEDRLLDLVLSNTHRSVTDIKHLLLEEVHTFVGGTPRQDDIALIVLRREA